MLYNVEKETLMESPLNRAVPEGCPYRLGHISLSNGCYDFVKLMMITLTLPDAEPFIILRMKKCG
jgi:hypothetical protein